MYYIYIYIYIFRGDFWRPRAGERSPAGGASRGGVYVVCCYVLVCIYIYIERERDIDIYIYI